MTFSAILYVFLSGGAGCVLRFLISWGIKSQTLITLPLATLIANIISCVVYALVFVSIQQRENGTGDNMKYLVLIGFCGGLSTFSTFSYETFELFRKGENLFAIGNIAVNNFLCIGLFWFFVKK